MHIRSVVAIACFSMLPAFGQTSDSMALLTQKLEGTVYVIPHRESSDGVLTACGIEFAAMKRDFSTKHGAPVSVVGSFYLRPNGATGIAYMLKMGVFDGGSFNNGVAPNNAFIRAPNGKAPRKGLRSMSESPGFALFVGGLDGDVVAALRAIAENSRLVVGFNRAPGQQDVTFDLDLTVTETNMVNGDVVRVKSREPVSVFMACSGDLMK
jgi:hypothetical protein